MLFLSCSRSLTLVDYQNTAHSFAIAQYFDFDCRPPGSAAWVHCKHKRETQTRAAVKHAMTLSEA